MAIIKPKNLYETAKNYIFGKIGEEENKKEAQTQIKEDIKQIALERETTWFFNNVLKSKNFKYDFNGGIYDVSFTQFNLEGNSEKILTYNIIINNSPKVYSRICQTRICESYRDMRNGAKLVKNYSDVALCKKGIIEQIEYCIKHYDISLEFDKKIGVI